MDKVTLESLTLTTVIGAYKWEQHVRQPVTLDITIGTDTRTPGESDDLADALDYAELTKDIRELLNNSAFKLIEALAESVSTLILGNTLVHYVEVTVHKPSALVEAKNVSVTIRREKAGTAE